MSPSLNVLLSVLLPKSTAFGSDPQTIRRTSIAPLDHVETADDGLTMRPQAAPRLPANKHRYGTDLAKL